MLTQRIYYFIKPFIPRSIQIAIRRRIVLQKQKLYTDVWPIDENAGKTPEGWPGWPGGKRFALILTHDVESVSGRARCWELAELEKEMGFRSVFNFVAEDYSLDSKLRSELNENGFEIGIHGLLHNGNLFRSRKYFMEQAPRINSYLKKWEVVGFRAPSMYHHLEWLGCLDIEYDMSTFDTDPFEPQPDPVRTIFPFNVKRSNTSTGYIELPYTLPQDHTLFVLLRHRNINIWKEKLDWIVEKGGMVLLVTHPDYMRLKSYRERAWEYPVEYYLEFLEYIRVKYKGQYWHGLPREVAAYYRTNLSG